MTRLLRIDCSITQSESISRKLSDYFVTQWCSTHAKTEVETLDLVSNSLPHFSYDNLGGMMAPLEMQTEAMRMAAALSDQLITQLERADILVIGCPMYNFTIPTQLKGWLDRVTIAGRTFRYTGPNRAEGMLVGKKVLVIEARGGEYSGPPASSWDFQEPLLRHWLGFLGLMDVHFVRVEGLRLDLERVPAILKKAQEQMVSLLEGELVA